jgi:hypothetical protein
MRTRSFRRFIGAAALLAALALPGTAAAQGGPPAFVGGLVGGGGGLPGGGGAPGGGGIPGGGGGIPGGGGVGGGAALALTFTLAPTADFPGATGTISVNPGQARVDASVDGTGLPLGTVVCLLENAAPIACSQVITVTGGLTFPHMSLAAFSLAPGTVYSVTRGTTSLPTNTIVSVTLP